MTSILPCPRPVNFFSIHFWFWGEPSLLLSSLHFPLFSQVHARSFGSYANRLRLSLLDNFLNVYTVCHLTSTKFWFRSDSISSSGCSFRLAHLRGALLKRFCDCEWPNIIGLPNLGDSCGYCGSGFNPLHHTSQELDCWWRRDQIWWGSQVGKSRSLENDKSHCFRFIGLGFLAVGAQNIFPYIKSYPLRWKTNVHILYFF